MSESSISYETFTDSVDQFVYLLLAILMVIASFLYIIRKMFKCYLSCKTNADGNRETTFKAGFRGDSPTSSTSTASTETTPIRNAPNEMPATPPHYEEEEV